MSTRLLGSIVAVAAVAAAMWSLMPERVLAQGVTQDTGAPVLASTPRTADGQVDFSGLSSHGEGRELIIDINNALAPGETLPIQPWALELTLARMGKDDPEANCLPTGVPRQAPYPWRILQTDTHMYFLFEGNIHSYRQIFMDESQHPEDPTPTWYGHSVGRFEGDTLVIDTVGFNDRFWFDFAGHPHTEQLHTIERYRRPDFDTLEYEVTIDDPGAYTRPFTLYATHRYLHDTELMEYICNENNQDVEHIVGKDRRSKYFR